jgi:hypothetical protein
MPVGPTGFTYTTYQSALVTQIPSLASDPNFQTILSVCIDYAELSINRDLQFLVMRGSLPLGSTTGGTATVSVPTTVVVLEALGYGAAVTPITASSRDYILSVYGGATQGPPKYYAAIGGASGADWVPAQAVLLGPVPDQAYPITAYCTQRQAPLSATNTTTFISQNLPDLFWAASMIYLAGYNRNFGAMSDDPRQAVSWEAEYARLLKGAQVEEASKRFRADGSSVQPASGG